MTWNGLIDFSKLPENSICGLTDSQIDEIMEFQANIDSSKNVISANTIPYDDLNQLAESAVPQSTATQQKKYFEKFFNFLVSNGLKTDIISLSKNELADYLKFFYSNLRTKDNKLYSPATLNCVRAALFRSFSSPPHALNINIIKDLEFKGANLVLKAMAKKYFEEGGETQRFDAIEQTDLKKLREYFDRSCPERLQEEVYFVIEYFLGTRGREWIRHLRKENIRVETDSNGKIFVEIKKLNTVQKNCQPAVSSAANCNLKQSRIYAIDDKNSCPVEAMKLLLSRLPEECNNLFYKPVSNWHLEKFWYNPKVAYGIHKIGDMMKQISAKARLSKNYTSHCIRSTVVTNMFNMGFTPQDIQFVTGHRNEDSVKRYVKRVGDKKKELYSAALNQSMVESAPHVVANASKEASSVNFSAAGCSMSFSSDVTISTQKKKMKICADGNENVVTITFE